MSLDFIYPPRPGGSITAGDLPYYEKSGKWLVQPKFNDTRLLTHIRSDGTVVFWTRHRTRPTKFDAAGFSIEVLKYLNVEIGQEYWLDGGVMNREKDAGGELIFFDVLFVGKYLFLKGQEDRLSLLSQICHNPQTLNEHGTALKIGGRLHMSPVFRQNFSERLKSLLTISYIEGLMLRRCDSQLDNYGVKQYEASWMKRCRIK